MRNLNDILGKYNLIDFLIRCRIDFKFFCEKAIKSIGGEKVSIQPFHLEWFQLIQNHNRVSILAPTGFGKTTILGVLYPIWLAFTYRNKQILIISKTEHQSTRILAIIKNVIEENELLHNLKPKDASEVWSKTAISTTTKCKIFCRPYSVNIKGEHVDYILMDEAASYLNPDIYFDYIVPRVAAKSGKIALISTPESTTDLMGIIRDKELDYISKIYPAIIGKESIWPEKFPIEKLEKFKKELGDQYFKKNYMCNPRAESEKAIYHLRDIMEGFDYDRKFSTKTEEEGKIFIGCDFAISDHPTADFDAYVVIEKFEELFIIKHIETHKGLPTPAKIRRICQLVETYKPIRVVIDKSNIGATIVDGLRSHGINIIPQEFHPAARNNLLMILKNTIDAKKLIFPRHKYDSQAIKKTNELVEQLIAFNEVESKQTGHKSYISPIHDDIVMALAMAIKEATRQKSASVYGASA